MLTRLFQPDEVEKIAVIPLSEKNIPDRRLWRFSRHGFITVKSAYHTAVEKLSRLQDNRATTSNIAPQWRKLWRIEVIPRVRMFLWKACVNALPTKANLNRQGSAVDPRCPLCGEEVETVEHIFIRCTSTHVAWYVSPLRLDMGKEKASSFIELVWNKIENFPKQYVELLAYTAWEIWRRRNRVCFENEQFDAPETARRVHKQWKENVEGRGRMEIIEKEKKKQTRWKSPDQGCLKLNCDVAIGANGMIGMGFVIRDAAGRVSLAGKEATQAEGDSTLMEALAMRFAMHMAKLYGIRVKTVESDSKNLVDAINRRQRPVGYWDIIISDIVDLAHDIGCKSFEHIPREINGMAHQAAKGVEFISIRHTPTHLLAFLDSEVQEKE